MRTREEGLGYWLAAGPISEQLTLWARVRRTFLRHLETRRLGRTAGEIPLEMRIGVCSAGEFIPTSPPVYDGLGNLAVPESFKGWKESRHRVEVEELGIHSPELLPEPDVKRIALPGFLHSQVNRQEWLRLPMVRSLFHDLLGKTTRVLSMACLHELGRARSCSQWLTSARIAARTGTARIAALPQVGQTLDLNEMKGSECESFLREAAALKGVAPGRGELLAVFRKVPIEVVSKLSFSRESRTIHYKLIFKPSLRRTRVHDLAAVRDVATDEIHLVAHRTRYRTVFFN